MGVGEVLDQIRAHYLERMTTYYTERRQNHEPIGMESVLRDAEGAPILDGPLRLPMRVDAVSIVDGKAGEIVEIATETELSVEPLTFTWESTLEVTLSGFTWNRIQVTITSKEPPIGLEPIWRWYQKWFRADIEARFDRDELTLAGAIHSLEGPTQTESGATTMIVDLGSARIQAFEEMLDACKVAGFSQAVIGKA
jgi:hypothetical protein